MSFKSGDVEKTVRWTGAWHVVWVKSKEDHMKVRNGSPTSAFWDLWREHKDDVKKLGFSVRKEENEEEGTSNWVVSYWADANDEEKEESRAAWKNQQARIDGVEE